MRFLLLLFERMHVSRHNNEFLASYGMSYNGSHVKKLHRLQGLVPNDLRLSRGRQNITTEFLLLHKSLDFLVLTHDALPLADQNHATNGADDEETLVEDDYESQYYDQAPADEKALFGVDSLIRTEQQEVHTKDDYELVQEVFDRLLEWMHKANQCHDHDG